MKRLRLYAIILITISIIMPFADLLQVQAASLPSSYRIYGDVNNNGQIDIGDLLKIRRHISASTDASVRNEHGDWILTDRLDQMYADVNHDGKITDTDVQRVQEHMAYESSGGSPSYKIVTVYLDFGSSVGMTNKIRCCPFAGNATYNSYGNIETVFGNIPQSILGDTRYEFIGWYTQASGGSKVSGTSSVGLENHMLYAHYQVVPTAIRLNTSSVTKYVGDKFVLSATVTPSNASQSITWSTSNSSVASVNAGNVQCKASGTATITAKTSNGITATCTVKVNQKPITNNTASANKKTTSSSTGTSLSSTKSNKKNTTKKYGARQSRITVYKQNAGSWKDYKYGYKNSAKTKRATIGSSGCGLVSVTNAVYYLNGKFINPEILAKYSLRNNFRVNGVGTKSGFCKSFINNKGKKYNVAYAGTISGYTNLKKAMNNGYVAVCSKPGHFMAIVDYKSSTGKFLLLDSYPSKNRGTSKGYAWKSVKQLKSLGLRTTFYLIKSR